MPIPHPDPGQRRLSLQEAGLGIGGERDLLEVEPPGQRRHRADPRPAFEIAHLGRHGRPCVHPRRCRVAAVGRHAPGGRGEHGRRFLHEPAGGVVEPHRKRQRLPGGDQGLGGHDLHPGRLAGRALRGRRDLGGAGRPGPRCVPGILRPQAIDPRAGHQVEEAVGRDRRGGHLVFLVEPCPEVKLHPVGRRLDHVEAARRADIELAVGHQRAAPDDRAQEPQRPAHRRAGRPVEGVHLGPVLDDVDAVADDDRHRPPGHDPLSLPEAGRVGDLAAAGRPEGGGRTHRGVVEVFLGLGGVDGVADDQRRSVDPPAGELEIPDGLAGAGLEVPDAAVARAEHDRRLAVEHGQRGRAVGRVFRELPGAVHPADRAGGLVHPQEAVSRPGSVAPAGHHGAGDHEIFEDHRDVRPTAVGREKPELLVEAPLPLRLARRGVDRGEHAAHAVGEDGVALGIGHHGRPADPLGRHVGEIDVEYVLPELPARQGVEADHLLRLLGGVGLVSHERVQPPPHDHRRRDAPLVMGPADVLPRVGVEGRHQRRPCVVPVLPRPPPIRPLGSAGTGTRHEAKNNPHQPLQRVSREGLPMPIETA